MPRTTAMLARAARRAAILSEEHLANEPNTLTHPFAGYIPCHYCAALLRNEADRSRHVILTPACLESHRQAMEQKRISPPVPIIDTSSPSHPPKTPSHVDAPTPINVPDSERNPTPSPNANPSSSYPPNGPARASELEPPQPDPLPPNRTLHPEPQVDEPRALPNDGAYIERFPGGQAGIPISADKTYLQDPKDYLASCGTLGYPDYFEIAELLMRPGLTNAVRNDLLKSKLYRGQTPWPNCKSMLADIDKLPHGPEWALHTIVTKYGGEEYKHYLYGRHIVDIVRELIGNRRFRHYMRYAPERHFTSKDRKSRVYSEMWTGNWWWRYQILLSRVDPKATIAPLIIASDKTTVSMMSGGQEVYPVYATIGNIAKSIRRKASERATILLGYLPIEKFENVASDSERARLRAELTHRSMEILMEPLKVASKEGVEMWCADGCLRRIYPIAAAFVGDWPEQNEMACTSQGGCPVCTTPHKGRGDINNHAPLRKATETVAAIRSYFKYDRHLGELEELNLKPWMPWWADLPYTNFHTCITPDLLHQLHQGLFKTHILTWVFTSAGPKVVDGRFSAMPRAQGMRHFAKRVSKIRQWTGRESKEIMKQLLPVIVGSSLSIDFVELIRSGLDFMYRAHASRMDDEDIAELENSLSTFHRLKEVVVESGLYKGIERFDDIPKIHMLSHYSHSTRELGTPDGFNSESPEHLHIIYAKQPYRASNKVKPKPQMLKLIQRREAIRIHRAYLNDVFGPSEDTGDSRSEPEGVVGEEEEEEDDDEEQEEDEGEEEECVVGNGAGEGGGQVGGVGLENGHAATHSDNEAEHEAKEARIIPDPDYPGAELLVAKHQTCDVSGPTLAQSYGTTDFVTALTNCMSSKLNIPDAATLISPFHTFPVWHKFSLRHRPLSFAPGEPPKRDVIRARPAKGDRPGEFDTVLILDRPEKFGLERYRAARVRAIFGLPKHIQKAHPTKFVYLELFKPFPSSPSPFHRMPTTAPQTRYNGKRHVIVLPITDIAMSCHLAPQFNSLDAELRLRTSLDLLSLCPRFFLNPYYNYYTFMLLDHWRRRRAQGHRSIT